MARFIVLAVTAAWLAACTPTAQSAQQAGVTTRTLMQDNVDAWSGLFSYHPKDTRPQLPQTRYCYQMQADIVCYDSPQPNMTAKMIGYQDGSSISWVQPGGGSLGVSGGEPTAPHDSATMQVAPSVVATTAATVSTAPQAMVYEVPQAPVAAAPFQSGQSTYATQ